MDGGFRLDLGLEGPRLGGVWMLGAFVVVFLLTRAITHLIHRGRGPFADTVVGGVHLHHLVHGIFLMLAAGAGEFVYRPDGGVAQALLAVAFGAGAALTLDEFALWLRLDDVYWQREGRASVDAVLVAGAVGALLVVGANPFDPDPGDSGPVVALTVLVDLVFVVVTLLKGKVAMGILGLLVPVLALVGACRLARPSSPWARRFYAAGSRRAARARDRYPEGRRTRWDALVDVFAGSAGR